jgi:hypothetical protein
MGGVNHEYSYNQDNDFRVVTSSHRFLPSLPGFDCGGSLAPGIISAFQTSLCQLMVARTASSKRVMPGNTRTPKPSRMVNGRPINNSRSGNCRLILRTLRSALAASVPMLLKNGCMTQKRAVAHWSQLICEAASRFTAMGWSGPRTASWTALGASDLCSSDSGETSSFSCASSCASRYSAIIWRAAR